MLYSKVSFQTFPVVLIEVGLQLLPVDGEPLHKLVRVERSSGDPIEQLGLGGGHLTLAHDGREVLQKPSVCVAD